MNIFFLDECPIKAANKQVSKSATKMVVETAQLMCSRLQLDNISSDWMYKVSHQKHPSALWVRKSREHYEWLALHGLALAEKYTNTYHKIHKSQVIIERCLDYIPQLPNKGFSIVHSDLAIKSTEIGLVALQEFKESNQTFKDVIQAYTKFYENKWYVKEARAKGEVYDSI